MLKKKHSLKVPVLPKRVCVRMHTRACVRMHGLMHMCMCFNHVMSSLIISMTDFFFLTRRMWTFQVSRMSLHTVPYLEKQLGLARYFL